VAPVCKPLLQCLPGALEKYSVCSARRLFTNSGLKHSGTAVATGPGYVFTELQISLEQRNSGSVPQSALERICQQYYPL